MGRPACCRRIGGTQREIGSSSGVSGKSDKYDSVKLEPMRESDPVPGAYPGSPDSHSDPTVNRPGPRRLPWAALLQRVFEIDALRCPRCGAPMRLVAAIEDPAVARKILACLDLPARAPPLAPAAPDETAWHESEVLDEGAAWAFDQTPLDGDGMT